MARRHARPASPYLGYANNNNAGYNNYVSPYVYHAPVPPPPLPVYQVYPNMPPTPNPYANGPYGTTGLAGSFPGPYASSPYAYSPVPISGVGSLNTLFAGNRAPLPEEMQALQHTLQMKETTLSFLESQIEAARSNLEILSVPYHDLRARFESAQSAYLAAKENHEDLIHQRSALDSSMVHLQALLNPLRRFQEDVLGKIFLFTIELERERDYSRAESARSRRLQAIINISRVCSKWRNAARGVPELWTYLRLNLAQIRRTYVYEKLAYFQTITRGLPIDVSISNLQPSFVTSEDSDDEEGGPNTLPILSSVNNLRSLTVNYTHYRALQFLPQLGTDCMDTLEELHLRSEPLNSPASGLFNLASYLAEAPNLRVLRLMHVHLLPPAPHESAPNVKLQKVKELVMYGPMSHGTDIFGFLQVVAMLPNVEKVTFVQNDTIPFTLGGGDDVTLGRLKELTTNYVALENVLRSSFGDQDGTTTNTNNNLNTTLQPPMINNFGFPNLPGQNNQGQGSGRITAPKLDRLTVVDAPNPTSGLVHFLNSVDTIRTLSFFGNFDPYSSAVYIGPGTQPGGGGWGNGLANMGGPMILPVQGGMFPLPPVVQTGGGQGNNGSGSSNGGELGIELLEAMKDIEQLEIINCHPRFVEALYAIIDVDIEEDSRDQAPRDQDKTQDQKQEVEQDQTQASSKDLKGKGKAVETSESVDSNPPLDPKSESKQDKSDSSTPEPKSKPEPKREASPKRPKRTRKAFQYLPNLRRLEITINKMFPLNRRDFEALFEARCLQGLPHTSPTTSTASTTSPSFLPSLEKLEIHLGSGLDEELAVVVGNRMQLDGEEKGSRWFSWAHPTL